MSIRDSNNPSLNVATIQGQVEGLARQNGTCSPTSNSNLRCSSPIINSTNSLDPILDIDKENNELTNQDDLINLSVKRWFVLFAMCVFGFSVAISCDTSPILSLLLELLDLPVDKYIYFNQTFYYLMAVMAIPTAWFVDKYGIKIAIQTVTLFYVISCTLKALLYSPNLPGWHTYKMYYYVIGSVVGTQVFAMFFLLPLKVSETWFSASERSVAWTIMISQLDLGVCIASFVYPRIMQTIEQIEIFAYINIAVVFVTTFVSLVCITSSAPEHPPSKRMAEASQERDIPFKESLKRMVTNKAIVVHLMHLATFESCILTVGNVLQVILTSVGHTKIFAGNFMSINALVAIFMLILMATFVHKVKRITLACKLGSAAQASLFIIYLITMIVRAPGWIVVIASILLTISKCWTTPNFTNMTAHLACGLVPQATIIGLSMTLTVILMTVIQVSFVSFLNVENKVTDYTSSLIFLSIVCLVNEAIYQILFQGKPMRNLTSDTNTSENLRGNENSTYDDRESQLQS